MSNNKLKSFHGKDVFSRMNYLYQASVLMAGKNNSLSAFYGNLCKSVGKRAVFRIEPNVKRTLCKRCGIALKPNKTADINFNDKIKNEQRIEIICKKCGFHKSYLINPNYNFWLENDNSIVEKYKFDENSNDKKDKQDNLKINEKN